MAAGVSGFLIDMEGVLAWGGRPVTGSVEALVRLRAVGFPFRILTNVTARSTHRLAEELTALGFSIDPEEIWNAPRVAGRRLAREPGPVMALVPPEVAAIDLAGLTLVPPGAEPEGAAGGGTVLVGDMGALWDYRTIAAAARWLERGARLCTLSPGRLFRGADGRTEIDAGPFAALLEAASGTEARLLGKPDPGAFTTAALDLALPPGAPVVMVGDDLDVDVLPAIGAGFTGVLVRSGKPVDDGRAAGLPPGQVVADFGTWLYKFLRIR